MFPPLVLRVDHPGCKGALRVVPSTSIDEDGEIVRCVGTLFVPDPDIPQQESPMVRIVTVFSSAAALGNPYVRFQLTFPAERQNNQDCQDALEEDPAVHECWVEVLDDATAAAIHDWVR